MDHNPRKQRPNGSDVSGGDNRITITTPSVKEIVSLWKTVEPWIARALPPSMSAGEVLTRLYSKDAMLWLVAMDGKPIAAVVTEVGVIAGEKLCNIAAAGGHGVNRWINYIYLIEDWASERGCKAVVIDWGRLGWTRLLKGYNATQVKLRKDLKHG